MKWNDLPKEIQDLILERQFEQTGIKNSKIFEQIGICQRKDGEGFNWEETSEDYAFWESILLYGLFDRFYAKYPKEENPEQIFSKNNLDYQNLKQEFEQYKKESIKWSVEDFLSLEVEGYHITPENAQKALERMIEMHDASIGINWEVVRFWFMEFAAPNDKYYVFTNTENYYKKDKDKVVFVGTGDASLIAIYEPSYPIPSYYIECTRDEFIAAYEKVKELLIGVQI